MLADLATLLGDDLQLRRRNGRLRIAGSWVSFPLRPTELPRALPPTMIARLAGEAVTTGLRRGEPASYGWLMAHRRSTTSVDHTVTLGLSTAATRAPPPAHDRFHTLNTVLEPLHTSPGLLPEGLITATPHIPGDRRPIIYFERRHPPIRAFIDP